jgi:type IV pilus assembly protein PilB
MSSETPSVASPAEAAAPQPSLPAPAAEPALPAGIARVQVAPGRIEPFLQRSKLLQRCEPSLLTRLAPHFTGLECQPGSTIVAAGGAPDGLGVLFSGKASIHLPDGTPVESLEPGDHFGEAALLSGASSPYTVFANEHCRVLWLRAEVAQSMLAKVLPVADALARRLAAQVQTLCALERAAAIPELPLDELPDVEPEEIASGPQIPFVQLADYDLQPSAMALLPTRTIRQHRVLPIRIVGDKLTLAMVNPRDPYALTELKRALQSAQLEIVAISADDFSQAMVKHKLDPGEAAVGRRRPGQPSINPDSLIFETVEAERDRERAEGAAGRTVGDDIIRLVNRVIVSALDREASDIHIEPIAGGSARVRFRVHGLLQDWTEQIQAAAVRPVTARIKVLAGLDITERRLPQDGRIGFTAGKREIDLRVSTLPANRGEKIVCRILEAAASTRHVEAVWIEPHTLAAVQRALHRPYGGIIVGGPTGSGKSTSIYALLASRMVVRPDNNIMTVEDPIEYCISGATQSQVNPAAGLGFAQVLRAMLRQDPDTIVVGETRDEQTAQLALEAAMTGHLLLTTLHSNNSVAALQRLESLGCSRALISQSVVLVLIQRLVRRLCTSCRKLDVPPGPLLEALLARHVITEEQALAGLPRSVGCDACNHTGYVGRIAICEAMEITEEVRTALNAGKPLVEVEQIALQSGALMPFSSYAAALMEMQAVSANEVLLTVAD